MSSKSAAVDLLIIVLIVSLTWSLRFTGISYVGPITMAVALLVVFSLLRLRAQSGAAIGLGDFPAVTQLLRDAGRLLPWFGLAWFVAGAVGFAFFGKPETGNAITELPDNIWLFLLDVTLITWILIAFGEEVVFRGFVLNRLLVLTGDTQLGRIAACATQAAWFGSLHLSQGGAGMVITASIGFVFAYYFLTLSPRSLWPLILVHGATDSIVLTLSRYFS